MVFGTASQKCWRPGGAPEILAEALNATFSTPAFARVILRCFGPLGVQLCAIVSDFSSAYWALGDAEAVVHAPRSHLAVQAWSCLYKVGWVYGGGTGECRYCIRTRRVYPPSCAQGPDIRPREVPL